MFCGVVALLTTSRDKAYGKRLIHKNSDIDQMLILHYTGERLSSRQLDAALTYRSQRGNQSMEGKRFLDNKNRRKRNKLILRR